MKWIKSHKKILLILLAVVLLLGITVYSVAARGKGTWIGKQAESVVSAVQKPFTAAGHAVGSFFEGITHQRELQQENEALKERISQLEAELLQAKLSRKEKEELAALLAATESNALTDQKRVTTQVTALNRADWFSTFTIGAGTRDGVQKNDAVFNAEGLVGRVMDVGGNWAKVVAVIHDSQNVSFKLLSDLDQVGILSGAGDGTLYGYLLDTEAQVEVGETLITSGMELYPEGILIGTVTSVSKDPDSNLVYVRVEPEVNFEKLRTVSVILQEEDR